ncbi:hypothetical protein LTR08_004117 [Meristemomyces frigidus]|nr:hypothetical protein LTR08_004117 [Meristemomyces frigidus]
MVDLGSWGDSAINAWVNLNPSTPWANKLAERVKGLPFGSYLHTVPPRRRALTGPTNPDQQSIWRVLQLFSTSEPEQRYHEQADCGFLSKLPLDIRMIIYDMVLGGMIFHLDAQNPKSRILLYICNRPDAINDSNHQCHELSTKRPSSAPRADYKDATGLLPLLTTCRQVYSESIQTLYGANTFEFTKNSAAFRFLKVMIPPQRLHNIRHYRMRMQLPHHPSINSRSRRDWNDLFSFLTNEMDGLLSLRLAIQMLQPAQVYIQETPDVDGADWIRPMVLMAIDANRRRGCKVEIVTGGVTHDLNQVYRNTLHDDLVVTADAALELTCCQNSAATDDRRKSRRIKPSLVKRSKVTLDPTSIETWERVGEGTAVWPKKDNERALKKANLTETRALKPGEWLGHMGYYATRMSF